MTQEIRFCPFCRESYEGVEECPEHELPLVPWRELPRISQEPQDQESLAWYEIRYGRGLVLLGAFITLAAFLCPLASLSGAVEVSETMLRFASTRTTRLWLVPLTAFAILMILYRRRSLISMRGARLAIILLSLIPSVVIGMTLKGIFEAAELLSVRLQSEVTPHFEIGSYMIWIALPLMVIGAIRLGIARKVNN